MNSGATWTAALLASLTLAACGGGSSGGNQSVGTGSGGGMPATVSAKSVNGVGTVIVDGSGFALYSPDQEASGTIMCVGACTTLWPPVTVAAGATPTAGSGVTGTLGVVKRPDGSEQVTINKRPLYRFVRDSSPGDANGNNVSDSFGSQSFTWHAMTASGQPATSSGRGGGYGGYGGNG